MKTTEQKHWVNGYQVRGNGIHKTFTLNIFNLGVMFIKYKNTYSIDLFKLI